MTKTEAKLVKEQGYNELPYTSYPFDYNRPENLHAVAHLFGVNTPPLENARILEMGGSDGGNLIKFAVDFPKAEIVGIDLAEKQVELGQKRLKEMGVKNYTLKHMSITDLDEKMGKFDYIICHGVYSWVPGFVRESILSNCNKLLSDNGVAFVSYNTLPGWNVNKTIRELMMYHVRNFEKTEDKVIQARLALDFVCESLQGADTPYAKFLQKMANDLKSKEDHYLRHEFLADENEPCYFYEFAGELAKHDLEYIGDTDYQRMNVRNLPKKAADLLSQIPDIIRSEQYTDFIMNSQFRCSLICKKGNKINRNISPDTLKQFLFTANILGDEQYDDARILSNEMLSFHKQLDKNAKVSSANPEQKAIFATFIENKLPLSYDEIINRTQSKFKNLNKQAIEQSLAASLGQLIFSRHIDFYSYSPIYVDKISAKPKIHDADLYRFKNHVPSRVCWLTSSMNRLCVVDNAFGCFLEFFDGNHTVDQIIDEIYKLIKNGTLTVSQNNQQINDEKIIKQAAKDLFTYASNLLLNNKVLVA